MRSFTFLKQRQFGNILTWIVNPSLRVKQLVKAKRDNLINNRREIAALVGLLFEEKPLSDKPKEATKNLKKNLSRNIDTISHCLELIRLNFGSSSLLSDINVALKSSDDILSNIENTRYGMIIIALSCTHDV